MNDVVNVETVKFKRPSSDKIEIGVRVSNNHSSSIIIDKDLNPIVNAIYKGFSHNAVTFTLDF